MIKRALTGSLCAVALMAGAFVGMSVNADEGANLVVNGEIEMVVRTDAPAHMENVDTIYSGWVYRADETQSLQQDDFDNPGMIWVDIAADYFQEARGTEGKSCQDCHDGPASLSNVRATYPQWDEERGVVQTLENQINECVTERMGHDALKYTGGAMINMTALLSSVARGTPINVAIDGPAQSTWEQGKDLYYQRTGQLELSCASCHEENYGNRIRSDNLSQGQINGFPTYRLKNAKLNSVHARFKGCVRDTRAQTYSPGSSEFVALELYLASRGNGLSVEGPSVRN